MEVWGSRFKSDCEKETEWLLNYRQHQQRLCKDSMGCRLRKKKLKEVLRSIDNEEMIVPDSTKETLDGERFLFWDSREHEPVQRWGKGHGLMLYFKRGNNVPFDLKEWFHPRISGG
uniref:Uncharacterized protein n=1 Tax=Ditylenchus dipsaci TaxID=166011 RepID=A0A915EIZ8_9BILA